MLNVYWTTRWFRKKNTTAYSWDHANFLTAQLFYKGARWVAVDDVDGELIYTSRKDHNAVESDQKHALS
jgi:hypothetical protein